MLTYIKIALRNVLINKRRSLFTIISVAVGTIIMILTFAFSNGVRENMVKNSLAMFTGHINVYGIQTIRGRKLNAIDDVVKVNKLLVEGLSNTEYTIMYKTLFSGDVYDPSKQIKSKKAELIGINIDDDERFKNTAITLTGELESIKKKEYAIIEDSAAKRYSLDVGDVFQFKGMVNTEEYGVVYNTIDLTVGAVIRTLDPTAIVSKVRISNETGRFFSMNKDLEYSLMNIYIDDKDKATFVKDKLTKLFKSSGYENIIETADNNMGGINFGREGFGPGEGFGRHSRDSEDISNNLRITTWNEETKYLEKMIENLNMISTFLNIVLLALILVGISNTLVVSVRERTYEIGTVRAIGMKRRSVMVMFIIEGIILGVIGIITGIVMGVAIALPLAIYGVYIGPSTLSMYLLKDSLYLSLDINMILLVTAVVTGISAVASIYPSYRASKLSPAVAMEKE